jgi:hypothetical protein
VKPYFATLPTKEIGAALCQRKDDFYKYLSESGRLALYQRIYDQYYRARRSGGQVYYTGEQGEYTNLDVNDFRNILLHLKVMTTNQRPSFEPRATNTDTKSQAQVILAHGLLDYYMREKKLDRYMDKASESAIGYGDGYVGLDWNATGGNEYAMGDGGRVIRDGDVEAAWFGPVDVPLDVSRQSAMDHDWRMTRSFKNKYVLAAKYASGNSPEAKQLYDKICGISGATSTEKDSLFHIKGSENSDLVPVYTFYHRKNEAVEQGRLTVFLSSDVVLMDGPLPFDDVPLYRMAPAEQDGTPFGYTIAFDLLPIQEAIDKLCSVILTNQSTFGVSNVLVPNGSNLTVSELADGLNAINYNPQHGKPEALNLTQTPAEIFRMVEMLRQFMQTLSGVNSVARGDPEASLKSGAALALVQSMAIQFNSGLQQSYAELASDIGTGLIRILRTYARSKRIAAISGKANRAYLKEWIGKDLSEIDRVVVDLGNPLMRTTAGRVNMADTLLESGKIETADQYISVLTTGKLEPLIEGKQAELMNIRSENEALAEGKQVVAVMTDAHALHIQEHKVVLASPESRKDVSIVQNVLAHIQKHIELLKTADPALLMILGQQPVPPSPPPPSPSGNPGAPPDVGVPITESGVPAPKMPGPPTNPLTGNEFDPLTGGLQ